MEEVAATVSSSSSSSLSISTSSRSFKLRTSPSLNAMRLRRIFDMFDKNGDGTITVEELSQALALLGLDTDPTDLESTLRAHIRPGKQGLEFQDFAVLHGSLDAVLFGPTLEEETEEREKMEESDLSEAFKVFDEDGDGYISANELQVVLGKLGLAEGGEIDVVRKMILSVDLNKDGRVDFFEFKDMMRSVLVPSS